MATKTEQYEPRAEEINKVWTLDAKLWVPYENGEIAYASPSFGPNTYQKVGQEILSHSLKSPVGDYIASLLHASYCNPKTTDISQFQDVKNKMRTNWLWVFNRNFWTDKGVYVIQDSEAKGRSDPLDINQLEEMLKGSQEIDGVRFSNLFEKRVRFVPKDTYKLGEHTSESLAKDGFVVASYNVDGAKKLAEVSSKLKNNSITYGVKVAEGNQPELRVSALGEFGGGLRVYGNGWRDDDWCHAFGVL